MNHIHSEKQFKKARRLANWGYVICVLYIVLCTLLCIKSSGNEFGGGSGTTTIVPYYGFSWDAVKWGGVALMALLALLLAFPWFRCLRNIKRTGCTSLNLLGAGDGLGKLYTASNLLSALSFIILNWLAGAAFETGGYSNPGDPLVDRDDSAMIGIGFVFLPAFILYVIMSLCLFVKLLGRRKK